MSKWDQRYASEEFQYGTVANDFLHSVAAGIPVGKSLCLGEGEGRNAVHLAQLGHQVMAVDGSAVGLSKAQRLAAERNVQIDTCVVDLADFEIIPEHWDSVVSIFCHLEPEIRVSVHRKVVAGLRSGGMLVLEAYRLEQLQYGTGGPPAAELLMSLTQLQQEFAGLNFLHASELEREVLEGSLHTGTGAVVQLLAVKP